VYSKNGLLTTVAWGINDEVYYALEGSVFVAGAAVQWLRDELKIIEKSSDTEAMALSVPDTNGVYFVPAFVGLGAPYWDPYARGIITGLTRGVNRNHLVRATLEAIAYQTWDVLEAMQEDSGIRLAALKVDGGASENRFLMQFQADIIGTQVERPANKESTAVGAAYLAGLAVGFWSDLGDVVKNRSIDGVFEPSMDETRRMELLQGWHKAVSRCRE
ncbi:MAG TPA: FGGY-family carbohydrate kinase, partial [Bacillota bacterium]|nr:FGGY-family carbohydrate kinase [Bacillota bacterium]